MQHCIRTYSGLLFSYVKPQPEQIEAVDIAHGLSNLCRFAGQCRQFYSVAQHSVLISYKVPQEYALVALLHDAAEAYCVDIPRPLKALLPEYKTIEQRVAAAIGRKFGVGLVHLPNCVHEADVRMLATEQRDLMSGTGFEGAPYDEVSLRIRHWASEVAEYLFMRRLEELTK